MLNHWGYEGPVIFHPQVSRISTDIRDFLARLEFYGLQISKITKNPDFKITLLVGIKKNEFRDLNTSTYSHLSVIRIMNPTNNFIAFANKSHTTLRRVSVYPTILIAGDLTIGLLAVILFRSFSSPLAPIQVSIHGFPNISNEENVQKFKSLIRKILLRITLPKVQSIRVVSKFLVQQLILEYKLDPEKFLIAPIPFETYPEITVRNFSSITLGVVGRLHSERNLSESLQILENVINIPTISKIYIVGDGPLRGFLESWKLGLAQGDKVEYFGAMLHRDMMRILPEIHIVISAAQSEGYGLAIREALMSGAVVIARKNEGSQDVLRNFKQGIYLYEEVNHAISMINDLANGRQDPAICNEGKAIQQKIDDESLRCLAASWNQG